MENEYAMQFNVKYDYDVLGGKPIYIIHLSGKDGYLAVGNSKKQECEIRGDTLNDVKKKCLEIRINTQLSHDIAENVNKELDIIKINNKVISEMPNYEYKVNRYKTK